MPTLSITKQYLDGTILTAAQLDAAFASVTTLVNSTGIGADNIQDNSIGAAEIQTSSITTAKIADGAVTTIKIADSSVSSAKLAADIPSLFNPTGSVVAFAGDTAPSGWLLCDGAMVSRTTYATLYALVGTRFGSGDAATTFHVPDMRGRFMRGKDGTAGRDVDSGSRTVMNTGGATGNNVGSIQDSQNKAHTHTTSNDLTASGGLVNTGASGSGFPQFASGTTTTSSNGGGDARPLNAYVNYIIKT